MRDKFSHQQHIGDNPQLVSSTVAETIKAGLTQVKTTDATDRVAYLARVYAVADACWLPRDARDSANQILAIAEAMIRYLEPRAALKELDVKIGDTVLHRQLGRREVVGITANFRLKLKDHRHTVSPTSVAKI
ncbi:hypothetical protein COV04_03205 [Candidatus Uhrbacteria bacterium CG10_big_fil_rev_8_21_14_0_10_48_11]|uniref:Uncharacterized protein n=1 Tax=Candidatus Uhrbacteria bacterium CG10_big_fil_rev_8_21_14_0_10_48_11 TaxID=1975037 RepID=A0A2M8LE88_9BACT|nr:MAG: hypothetical protein COV04_03205 [Candidatus Uhrbacteria bacterium CG10_big_fil_rev_8_21_14_0_10_48_11]